MTMALAGRLQFIYENLVPEKPVWDFCCDHGYLGIEALRSLAFPEVHFVDQAPHLIETLEKLISTKFSYVYPQARFFAGKGEDLAMPVTGTAAIAGVGAHSIYKILEGLWQKDLLKADRLILCPQRDEQKFLLMLADLGEKFAETYAIRTEHELLEKWRKRQIFILNRAASV